MASIKNEAVPNGIKTIKNQRVQTSNDTFGVCYRRGFRRISGFPVCSDPPPPRVNSWLRVHVTSFARPRRQPRAVLWRPRTVYFYRRARVAASESREDSFLPQSERDSRAARDVFATLPAARGVAGQKRGGERSDRAEGRGAPEQINTAPQHHRLSGRPAWWLVPQRVMMSRKPPRGPNLNARSRRATPNRPARRLRNGSR